MPLQLEPESLTALVAEASKLLASSRYTELASRFGYAIALGRTPSAAIQQDLEASLAQLQATHLDADATPKIDVKFFGPTESLVALAESRIPTQNGRAILLELVVTASSKSFHATVEQVSGSSDFCVGEAPGSGGPSGIP